MALADTGRAVGAVTQMLRDRLQNTLQAAVPPLGEVTVGRPNPDAGQKPALNLFLYEIQYDATLRNYSPDNGQVAPLWLVLRYLLTAFDEQRESDSVDAHIWLGQGMSALQDMNFLRSANPALVDSPEPLKLSFEEATPDLLSKLLQGEGEHIRCSTGFQVRPVMIARGEPSSYSLLVGYDYIADAVRPDDGEEGIHIFVSPSVGPQLTSIDPPTFEIGDEFTLEGTDLHLSNLVVRLDDVDVDILERHPDRLVCRVPAVLGGGVLISPGNQPVRLVEVRPGGVERQHSMLVGGLRPTVNAIAIATAPVDPLDPGAGLMHTIRLGGLLLGTPADGAIAALYRDGTIAHSYDVLVSAPLPTPPQTDVQFEVLPAHNVGAGNYRVILRVNGQQAKQSPLVAIP